MVSMSENWQIRFYIKQIIKNEPRNFFGLVFLVKSSIWKHERKAIFKYKYNYHDSQYNVDFSKKK